MDTFRRIAVQACVIFVLVLALLAGLEAAARIAKFVKSQFNSAGNRILLKQQWGKQLAVDQGHLEWRYENYVGYREQAVRSSTTNVDGKGRRAVPGNCRDSSTAPSLILLFGGSTMFGYGVPDQFTVPAYLASALDRSGRCVEILNYGAGWWQSSQSVIQLLIALREGVRPSAVVFYDGINDVDVVAFGGAPGGMPPDADELLGSAFEDEAGWKNILRNSVFFRVTARLLSGGRGKSAENAFVNDRKGFQEAAAGIVQVYVHNVRAVEALAREYGFDAYFFLQPFPVISGKTNTLLENEAFRERARYREGEAELIRAAYDAWRNDPFLRRDRRFHDISRIFDGMTQELYVDTEHLLPEGNRLVAEKMANEIRLNRQ